MPTRSSDARDAILPIGYALGLMLFAIPAIELIITSWSPQAGVMEWRFGAFGLLANQLLFPVIGYGLLLYTAYALEHRSVFRGLGIGAVLGCLALAGFLGVFALDSLHLRETVPGDARVGFHAVVGKALINLFIATLTWGWLGFVSLRAARKLRQKEPSSVKRPVLGTPATGRARS